MAKPRVVWERPASCPRLTRREREVLALWMEDREAPAIAAALFVSERTIHFHLRNLRRKLGCRTTHGALVEALRWRLVDV